MRRLGEIPAFLALALAAHLAMLAYEPLRGSDAGGSGGAAVVTLAAAPEQIDQLLREWMQAPEAETAVAAALGAFDPTPQPPPELHSLALDPAPRALVQVGAMAVPELPRAPAVETGPPSKDRPETEREAAPEKTAKRTAPASGTAMQKAAGAGRTSQAGRDGPAVVKALSSGQQAKLISVWGARPRSRIERKKSYPRGARGSGVVRLRIHVARSGQLLSSRVVKSSRVAAFGAAALAAIARAAPFPPAPKRLTDGSYSFPWTCGSTGRRAAVVPARSANIAGKNRGAARWRLENTPAAADVVSGRFDLTEGGAHDSDHSLRHELKTVRPCRPASRSAHDRSASYPHVCHLCDQFGSQPGHCNFFAL